MNEICRGINIIDENHQIISNGFNILINQIKNKENLENIIGNIKNIKQHMKEHFYEEELIMYKIGCKDLDHIKEHRYFIKTLRAAITEINRNTIYMEIILPTFAYLNQHLITFDKKLADQIFNAAM